MTIFGGRKRLLLLRQSVVVGLKKIKQWVVDNDKYDSIYTGL